jgi:hypothetical protein
MVYALFVYLMRTIISNRPREYGGFPEARRHTQSNARLQSN